MSQGTTSGGAFRFPYDFSDVIDPIFEMLQESDGFTPEMGRKVEDFIALYMDRDRALEDYSTELGSWPGPYDAIVDYAQASNPSRRIFQGIGEAINYLSALPEYLNGAMTIGVRHHPSGTAYTETTTVSHGGTVSIVGLTAYGNRVGQQGSTSGVVWDTAGQTISISTLMLRDLEILATSQYFSGTSSLYMDNTNLSSSASMTAPNFIVMVDSRVTNPTFGAITMIASNCQLGIHSTGTILHSNQSSAIKWFWFNTAFSGTHHLPNGSNPSQDKFAFIGAGGGINPSEGSHILSGSIVQDVATQNVIVVQPDPNVGYSVTLTDPSSACLVGTFSAVTRTNNTANGHMSFTGNIKGVSSIAAPLTINAVVSGSGRLTLTGDQGITGSITLNTDSTTATSYLTLSNVAHALLQYSAIFNSSPNSQRPLQIDSDCEDIIIDYVEGGGWPLSASVAGTDVLVRTSAGSPPAGVAGGDLGGSYPNPTVVNITQLQMFEAKGDLLVATADDTPARLAVGLDQRELAADSTAPGGVSWRYTRALVNKLTQNQASLETDTTGWTASSGSVIAQSLAQAAHGAASLEITKS